MTDSAAKQPAGDESKTAAAPSLRGRAAMMERHRWLMFVVPFVVFMAAGMFEPASPTAADATAGAWRIPYTYYPVVYTFRLALTLAAILWVLPGYRAFPFRVRWQSWPLGLLGAAVWIGLCESGIQERLFALTGLDRVFTGGRVEYNPFLWLGEADSRWPWIFLAVRFAGLVLIVPVIEEFFLRGFLMRFFASRTWWEVPIGALSPAAWAVALIYPAASHPEILAALVWFSGVTWWAARTRNIWDAIVVHGVTNLLLGVYVVCSGRWVLM